MPTMTPDQATFVLHAVALPMLKNEHAVTKRVIEAIPLTGGDYRPDPNAKSAMELAWHVVAAEHRFLGGVADGVFDFTPNHRPETVHNSADMAKWFDESFNKNIARITAMSGADLAKELDFRGIFKIPAVMFLTVSNSHSIHHRGQLSVYLRPMGGRVPAIYGESYDSAEAKKAAGAA
jgi:uncharacterized damage-inducible protein DinB